MFSGLISGIRYEGSLFYVFFYSESCVFCLFFGYQLFVRMRGGFGIAISG